ncbi:MAG: hypothetical protein JXQ73_06615, partial [Phycisphaerae bacterium]|nr:hypothetical protein [Phycisphaerae bacterium]
MSSAEANSPSCSTGATPDLVARAFGWGEVFVLIPLHAFWVLYKSTPFVAENMSSAFVAVVPLGAMVVVGLLARLRVVRAAIVGIEWALHLSAAACMAMVLLYVALRDPFNPVVPITWPLCLWSVAIAFALLADLALHERTRASGFDAPQRKRRLRAVAAAIALWVALVWLAAGMTWTPYFLTVSVVFHAVVATAARRGRGPDEVHMATRHPLWQSAATFVEALFAVALMLTVLLRFVFVCHMTGTAELKYFQFIDVALAPWFVAGAALALLASRLRAAFLAHAVIVAVLLLSDELAVWPVALIMGYGLSTLLLASTREGALAYSASAAVTTAIWILGLLGFMLAGVIIVFEVGLDFVKGLMANMRVVTPGLYAAWLVLVGVGVWHSKRQAAPEPEESMLISPSARGLAYAAICMAILAPIACLILTTMWPAVWLERPPRVEVGEPAGICHAGYSRSDEEYAILDELGVRLMRVDFHWRRIQPTPDTWRLDHFDGYLDAAHRHNVKVLALLCFDNNAVEQSPSGSKRGMYIAPEDVPLFLEYVRRTVGRCKDRVYAWEIWNEPDMPRFWTGTAEEFYELARRTAETVRQVYPEARILGSAMTSGIGVGSAEEVEGLHTSGALKDVDHPTMHTYLSDPRAYYGEFLRVRNAAAKHGHPGS